MPDPLHYIRIWIRGFFGFSQKETNAFLILLPLMIAALISEPLYRRWKFAHHDGRLFDQHYADSILTTITDIRVDSSKSSTSIRAARRFRKFDPNTMREDEMIALGLSPALANRVIRYRLKGGKFKNKNDLLKIYGMDSVWFNEAIAWIIIPPPTASATLPRNFETKIVIHEQLDINSADSVQLVNVFGIGPTLSRRIRAYRDRLGGFISMDQVSEVYGLDTIVLKQLKKKFAVSPDFRPQQIDLNSETVEELIRHPYIKRKEAYMMLNYRRQHGDFKSINDLQQLPIGSSDWLEKLKPYLKL
jgi:competence protein ComEA